ncbi:hypothetical protein [Streptomyces sp. NPDC047097]|uniref:hypothetical protein n=1 Tax=Streptomyces sp. NPDC047097 TaxID=3155260 RepID=UPI0033E5AEA2
MTRPPTSEVAAALVAALRGETPAIICPTRCEPCMYDQHYTAPAPHPWAGPEDIEHARATGQPEPTGSCGCWCAQTETEQR